MKPWGTVCRFGAGLFLLAGLLPAAAVAQSPEPAGHCLLVPLPAAARARAAELVVEAEVLDTQGFWDAGHRHIYTAHRLRVFSVLKGQMPAELTIITEGGRVDLDEQQLTNTLRLTVGEQGVFFLAKSAFAGTMPAWTPYASEQGFIRYDLTEASAAEPFRQYSTIDSEFYAELSAPLGQPRRELLANPALAQAQMLRRQPLVAAKGQAPVIGTLAPTTVPAGIGAILTISGSGFGSTRGTGTVDFRSADDGGVTFTQARPSDYVSWTDTQIRVRVPSNGSTGSPAGTGTVRVTTAGGLAATSTTVLVVPFAASNVLAQNTQAIVRPNHINQNGEGGYTFRFNPGFASNPAATAAFERALLTTGWRCQTGVNWQLGAVRTASTTGSDGENSIGFDSGAELPTNVLGRTTSYYQGCFNAAGGINFRVNEIDMQFDDGVAWQYGPGLPTSLQFDFETVVLHELGHAQQLGHVNTLAAVMYYGVGRGRANRTLTTNDRSGGRLVLRTQSFPVAGCGPAPMLPAPLTRLAATANGPGTEITWNTREECFLSGFIVERGTDTTATAWQPVATVAAAAAGGTYRVADAQALPGLSYYRLRLVRPDGSIDSAAPLLVQNGDATTEIVQIYPNPVNGNRLQFLYAGTADGNLSLYVYDAVGRACLARGLDARAGLNTRTLDVGSLRAGWYVLRWRDQAGRSGTVPFVKVN